MDGANRPNQVKFLANQRRTFNQLRVENRLCDIRFRIGERTFPAHFVLLAARSEVLLEVLGINIEDYYGQEEIVLHNVDVDVLEQTLEMIYFVRDVVNQVAGA